MDYCHGTVLVTGADGFVGRALCERLIRDGWRVRGAIRQAAVDTLPHVSDVVSVGNIGPHTDWSNALRGVATVVHLAARVHIMNRETHSPLDEYRLVNTQGTECLARKAAESGVRRFIYVSSAKVNGETTGEERPFHEEDIPSPQDPYAVSKWEAEKTLQIIARQTGLGVVILRPPLIYGPNVHANFLELIRMVDRGIPLPLKNVRNRRSMIYLGNFTDAIIVCLTHPRAQGEIFLVSDNETVSTAELITRVAHALRKRPRLFSFPKSWTVAGGRVLGRRAAVERLIGSLEIDNTKIRRTMNWAPPFSMEEGLRITADWYEKNKAII